MSTRHKKWLWRAAVLVVAVVVCLYGPAGCGWATTKLAPRALQRAGVTARIDGMRVGLFSLRTGAIQLSGEGWAATSDEANIRYTPLTLVRRRIEMVEVDAVQVTWMGGKMPTNTAVDAWQDLNPAAMLAQTVAALKGWHVTKFSVLDLSVHGLKPVSWRAATAITGRMQGPANECSLTATFAPLSVSMTGAGDYTVDGGVSVTAHADTTGATAVDVESKVMLASQHTFLPVATIAADLSFKSSGVAWQTEGSLSCEAHGSQLPALGATCRELGLRVTLMATGTTFRTCGYDIIGNATAQALNATPFTVSVPLAEGSVRFHSAAGNAPQIDGTVALPLITGGLKAGTAELASHATFEGVWPFDRLSGSIHTRVSQIQATQHVARDSLHGSLRWTVLGLTNQHTMAWQAFGSVNLDTAALSAMSGVSVDTANITCEVTAAGDATGALWAKARTPQAITYHTSYNGGAVSGVVAAVTGSLTISSGVARARAEIAALTAIGVDFTLADGGVRLTGETSVAAAEAGEWQATADMTAGQIEKTGSETRNTVGPLALPIALSGLHASCKVRGRATTVEAIEDVAFGWSDLTALGGSWLPGAVSATITGGVLRAGGTVRLAQSALQAEVTCDKPLQPHTGAQVTIRIPETRLRGDDAWLKLVPAALALDVSEGVFAASAVAEMRPARSFSIQGEAHLRDGVLSGQGGTWTSRGLGAEIDFGVTPDAGWQAVGTLTAARAAFDKLVATNVVVSWRADPREFFVERAQAGWCGGVVRVFAVHADVRTQRAELTLFIDNVQLAEILGLLRAMPGTGQGQLYGRLPLRYENKQVKLSDGFLYSLPGEGGRVQIGNTAMIEEALKGVDPRVREQVIPALHDLLFSVFRLDLTPPDTQGGDALLKLRLAGEPNDRRDLSPVDLTVNLRGPLEALFNMGMRMGGH